MAAKTTREVKNEIEVPCSNEEKVLNNYMMLCNEEDRVRSLCAPMKLRPAKQPHEKSSRWRRLEEPATFVRFEELLRSPPALHSRIRTVGLLVFENSKFWLRSMMLQPKSIHQHRRLLLTFHKMSRLPDPATDVNIYVMVLGQHSRSLYSPQDVPFYCVHVWNQLENQKQIDMCFHLYDTIKALHS
ncbi:PREDICTED: uncharacterized protein LOC108559009 [Nicrophorus vespilloides]|uniref:Uncharacterized protein LOC108559009 n=1 Tax=Nicrophorus vespilloides TaxID=110193 RepID=A0ABM1MAL5_NICVS|nr:PREDICTED: uncharacterized protein LOC108559009 [Nicrophorus vespilloides]